MAAVLATLAMAAAGCVSTPVPDAGDGPLKVIDETPAEPGQGLGTLVGMVLDEGGIPVWDTHIAILGTALFGNGDKQGRFAITGIAPGEQRVRVSAPGYEAAEDGVEIKAGSNTTVEIVLFAEDRVGAGYRPHTHDLWGELTEIGVVDQWVTIGSSPAAPADQWYNTACTGESGTEFLFNQPDQVVYEGTKLLRVAVSWNGSAAPGGTVRFQYYSAGGSEWVSSEGITNDGEVELPLQPTDWDDAHQAITLWQLRLCKGAELPRIAYGEFHVSVTMVKDPDWQAPFDEPHPRFWEETDRIEINDKRGYDYSQLLLSQSRPTQPFAGGSPYYTGRFTVYPGDLGVIAGAQPGVLIPPGASHLEAELTWTYGNVQRGQATPWSLSYRSAEVHPMGITPGDLRVPEPESTEGTTKKYVIPLLPGQHDGFYQERSNWMFFLNLEGQEAAEDYTSPCYPCTIDVRLSVWAVRDPGADVL